MRQITKFVSWDVPPIESLKGGKAYELRQQLNRGEKMSREQKDWLTKAVNGNTYFKTAVPVSGYRITFDDVLKRFIVKQYDHLQEYYATDKTALRNFLCGKIDEIIEV